MTKTMVPFILHVVIVDWAAGYAISSAALILVGHGAVVDNGSSEFSAMVQPGRVQGQGTCDGTGDPVSIWVVIHATVCT